MQLRTDTVSIYLMQIDIEIFFIVIKQNLMTVTIHNLKKIKSIFSITINEN